MVEKDSEKPEEEQLNDKISDSNNSCTDEVTPLRKELLETKDKYIRLFAEFDNYKKRVAKERSEIIELAEKDLILALLPVIDDFDRALKVDSTNEVLVLINSKINKTLEKKGLQKIKTDIGDDFDDKIHDAIARQNVVDEKLDGKIINIAECGYMFRSKIIRFAKVVIGESKK